MSYDYEVERHIARAHGIRARFLAQLAQQAWMAIECWAASIVPRHLQRIAPCR